MWKDSILTVILAQAGSKSLRETLKRSKELLPIPWKFGMGTSTMKKREEKLNSLPPQMFPKPKDAMDSFHGDS